MKMTVRAFCLGAALLTAAACGSRDTKETRLAKGDALMAEGKVGEALIEYQTAVQLDGRDGTARHKLATAFIKAGDLGKALEQVVRAADLMPDNADVQLDAATALLMTGRSEDAKTRAETVLKTNPKNVRALVLRAGADAGLRETNAAIDSLNEAIKIDPTRSETYSDLATLQFIQGTHAGGRLAADAGQ